MGASLVVMDVGDVLVRTVPTAGYRALGRLTGLDWEAVSTRINGSGLRAAFGTGHVGSEEFAAAVRELLDAPELTPELVREAWNAVMAEVDPVLSVVAAPLATAGRLLLASNINPFHWAVARQRLADAGVIAPACLSYQLGCVKPDPAFFAAVAAADTRVAESAVFVDDQPRNVDAAVRSGMTGWLHRDSAATARYLTDLATDATGLDR